MRGVVVYLFSLASHSAGKASVLGAGEMGVLSTETDSSGYYLFTRLKPGQYRVEPNTTGLSFQPPTISVDKGETAPSIVASPVNLNDEECGHSDHRTDIVVCDGKSKAILDFAHEKVEGYVKLARRKLKGAALVSFTRSLNKASTEVSSAYTHLLQQSVELPKVSADCPGILRCRKVNLAGDVKMYRKSQDSLRRLSFFILRRSREALDGSVLRNRDQLARKLLRLHSVASSASRKLPKKNYICTATRQ